MLYAIVAYLIWGMVPLYWKFLHGVPSLELIAHRVIWTLALALGLIAWRGRWREFVATWRRPRGILLHAVAGVFIALNWLAFVWAVLHDRVLDTSLGYFMCPLVSVVLATLVLGERLRPLQWASVIVAALGVGFMVFKIGSLPIPALVVAITWSGYGLIKKRTRLGSITGLGMEAALLAPLALGWMAWQAFRGTLSWDLGWGDWQGNVWLLSTGLVTIAPLICFAEAAKTLRLTTLGLFQYAVPSATFFLAIFYFREPFEMARVVTFVAIWLGLALYGWDRVRERRAVAPANPPVAT